MRALVCSVVYFWDIVCFLGEEVTVGKAGFFFFPVETGLGLGCLVVLVILSPEGPTTETCLDAPVPVIMHRA